MSKVCPICSFDNPDIMRYCGGCGIRLPELGSEQADADNSAFKQFGGMIGANLQERFKAAGLQAAGQKRHISILFVDLSGFTHMSQGIDPETLYEVVQHCSQLFANSVYKFDGMVDKFTGDGLMALFGAPIAHENNAELAVRAALDIQEQLRIYSDTVKDEVGQELTAHIGLNSGLVIVGGIGSNLMMNYTAIGDVVNIASRIMNIATADQILISERMYKQVRAVADCVPFKKTRVKGVDKPLQPYLVKGLRERSFLKPMESMYSPLIGRKTELEILDKHLADTITNKEPHMIMMAGEAGIGKTRLTHEWLELHALEDLKVLTFTGAPYTQSTTYSMMVELTRQSIESALNTPVPLQQSLLQTKIEQIFPDDQILALTHFERLLSLPATYPEVLRSFQFLEPEQIQNQLFRYLAEYFRTIAKNDPLVLVLSHLQWVDPGSFDFIRYIVENTPKAGYLIIMSAREFSGPQWQEFTDQLANKFRQRSEVLEIPPLTDEQCHNLINNLLPGNQFSDEIQHALIERSSGIPLYIEEMSRALVDEGIFAKSNGQWIATKEIDITSLPNTDTLEGLILSRFDKLDSEAREILKFASVIGRSFSRELISECLEPELLSQLDRAIYIILEKDFLRVGSDMDTDLSFPNMTIQGVIYQSILKKDRRGMHARIGAGIENLNPENLDQFIDPLSFHYSNSDRYDKGLRYLLLAGKKAFLNYNTSQALNHYDKAISFLGKTESNKEQVYDAYYGAGESTLFLGKYKRSRNNFSKLVDVIENNPQYEYAPAMISAVDRKIAQTFDKQGDMESAIAHLTKARAEAEKDEQVAQATEMVQIFNDLAWIDFRRGQFEKAETGYHQALELIELINMPDVVASIYNRLGGLYFERNQLSDALKYSEQALKIRESSNDQQGLAKSLNNIAILNWKIGNWDEARGYFQRCLEIEAKLGDVETYIIIQSNYGMLLMEDGDPGSGLEILESTLASATEIEHLPLQATINLYIGKIHNETKTWNKASNSLETALALFAKLDDPEYNVDTGLDLSRSYAALGQIKEAEKQFKKALRIFNKLDDDLKDVNAGKVYLTNALILAAEGQKEGAEEAFLSSIQQYLKMGEILESGRSVIAYYEFLNSIGESEKFNKFYADIKSHFTKDKFNNYVTKGLNKARDQ